MKKLQSLRDHLLSCLPELKGNPDRLLTFVEDGSIEFHRGVNLSHQYSVPARIVVTDFVGDLDTLMIPVLQWVSHFQPDIEPTEAIRFQAEILSNKAWDIAIEITLTERVVAKVNCDSGRIEVDHRLPEFPIDPCSPAQWALYIKSADPGAEYELVAQWDDQTAAQV